MFLGSHGISYRDIRFLLISLLNLIFTAIVHLNPSLNYTNEQMIEKCPDSNDIPAILCMPLVPALSLSTFTSINPTQKRYITVDLKYGSVTY
jgi:hypothetical protein